MQIRQLFQFRLSTLLWLMFVCAVGVGGYRMGLDEKHARQQPGAMYSEVYFVNDLVLGHGMTKPDFDSLIEHLVLLSPTKWAQSGGAGSVTGYDNTGSIVVYQDATTHRQIKRKLAAMRRYIRWHWLDKQDRIGSVVAYLHGDDKP